MNLSVWAVMALAGFAAARAARIVTADTITAGLRERIKLWAYTYRPGANGKPKPNRARLWFNGLITCPHCAGWWFSMITGATILTPSGWWRQQPMLVSMVQCWMLAGVQSFLVSVQRDADSDVIQVEEKTD